MSLLLFSLTFTASVTRAATDAAVISTNQSTTDLLIIPEPKSLHRETGIFVGRRETAWWLQGPECDERLWLAASSWLAARTGQFTTNSGAGYCLEIGKNQRPAGAMGAETNEPWGTNPEGYHLLVTTQGISLEASTAQGAFYGLQTLGQLMKMDGRNFSCPAVEIKDWPSLRFRGVHWFPSASGTPMYRQLIDTVFSTLKFNQCVVQCEAARWDSHPEIAMTNSISKADLRMLVEECRRRFIEPIPLVDVPGHADWMFRHHQNTNLVEDPATPYACCVRNPQTIKLIEDVMTECIDVFHPQMFHIGFDEITLRGRFPNPDCPFCHGATATTLMTESANRLAEWLAARGIKTMMWGDMLLGPGEAADATSAATVAEAKLRRSGLSKKITIADWHYVWNADSTSLDALQRDGFHTIAATWEEPVNIFRFSQAAIFSGADGLLQTTWDGYFPDQREIKRELEQFAAYVIAADYAWSGRRDPPAQLGYDAREIFRRAYQGKFGWPGEKNIDSVN
jgi:hexosaminidase